MQILIHMQYKARSVRFAVDFIICKKCKIYAKAKSLSSKMGENSYPVIKSKNKDLMWC